MPLQLLRAKSHDKPSIWNSLYPRLRPPSHWLRPPSHWLRCLYKECSQLWMLQSSPAKQGGTPHPSKHSKSPGAEVGISEWRHPMYWTVRADFSKQQACSMSKDKSQRCIIRMNENEETLPPFMLGEPFPHLGPTNLCTVPLGHAVHLSLRWLGPTLSTLPFFPCFHLTTRPHFSK